MLTFSDANTTAPLTDFTAVVQWGDGTSSTITSSNGITGSSGNYTVKSSHTYITPIPTPTDISVTVYDDGGANVGGSSAAFTVPSSPLPPSPPPPPPPGPPSPPPPPSGGGGSSGGSTAPDAQIRLLGVSDTYGLFNQTETVKIQVNGLNGVPLAGSQVTVTDGGISQTVTVGPDGTATAIFTFSLSAEQPNNHGISVDNLGFTTMLAAPGTTSQYFFQIFFDLLLIEALANGG